MSSTVHIILGMHRSGTSLVSHLVHRLLSIESDSLLESGKDNPQGFWEDTEVLQLNINLLRSLGVEWNSLSQFDISASDLDNLLGEFGNEASAILKRKLHGAVTWSFKDPRTTRFLAFWKKVLEIDNIQGKYIFCNRNPLAVAHSLKDRNGFSLEYGLILYGLYVETAITEILDDDLLVIDYETMMGGSLEPLSELATFLGVSANSDELHKLSESIVDVSLDHHKRHRRTNNLPKVPFSWAALLSGMSSGALTKADAHSQIQRISKDESTTREILSLADNFRMSGELKGQQLETTTQKNEKLVRDNGQLRADVISLKAGVDLQNQKVEELEVDLGKAASKVEELEVDLGKAASWEEEQSRVIGDLKKQEIRLNQKVEELEADLGKAASWEEEQSRVIGDLRKQEIRLREDISKLTRDLKVEISSLEVQAAKIAKLETSLEDASKWSENKEKDIAELETSLESALKWNEKQRIDISELNMQIGTLSKKHEDSERKIANLSNKIDEKSVELEETQRENESELRRVWEIAEQHRLDYLEVTSSRSWKYTAPIRSLRAVILRRPRVGPGAIKRSIVFLLDLFPDKWELTNRLVRLKQIMSGKAVESDSLDTKEGHLEIISNRQSANLLLSIEDIATFPAIDISVVSYNNGKFIPAFMASLLSQSYPTELINLVVVDNTSTDDTLSIWKKFHDQHVDQFHSFEILVRPNLGFGCGHHAGFGQTSSEFVLVSNLDIEFTGQALQKLLSFAVQDQESTAQWELRQQPYEHPKFYDPVTLETAWSSGACFLVRRSAYEDIGGFEKRIFLYGEDVELSFRLRDRGHKVKYVPSAVVYHYTYEEENEVKPLQFYGSTLANSLLRIRYGNIGDIMGMIPMYSDLFASHGFRSEIGKGLIKNNTLKLAALFFPFLVSRKHSNRKFSFRGWDYEMSREGAFYTLPTSNSDNFPLVSIIIRTYENRDYWLREALNSVLNQSYPNIEVIIVEDGSDSQVDFVAKMQHRYPTRTLVYESLPKKGRCYSANIALEMAKGEMVGFLDDDDLFFSDHVETCVAELVNDNTVHAVYCLAWEVETKLHGESLTEGYEEITYRNNDILGQEFNREALKARNCFPIQAVLFRRELYEKYGGLNIELDNLEDWNLWIRYSAEYDFKLVPKTTSIYRTPFSKEDRLKRQEILDDYLPLAISINSKDLQRIENDKPSSNFSL
ncbi:MAG: hypothetical protein CMQ19_07600 [Gammaproteobacteria bacterium]|nr:hypothetical protein [Gammaproteobacteria bacterium]